MSYDVNSLEAHWMPFSANRDFKANPRMVVKSEGMYMWDYKGGQIIDGSSALFCTPAGHGRREIAEAVYSQMLNNDYTPHFQLGHPGSFELAERVCRMLPDDFNHMFFTNSGSESIDTAIKIILAYQRARGQSQRNRLISRERAYHGVNMGGVSLAGMVRNRETFGLTLPNISMIRHTWTEEQRFSKGQPKTGAELALDLERIAENLGGSTLAAVFIEPVAGSTGTLVPPEGYLQKVREICDKHGMLLVFDEVITGFGRLGSPFAADFFGVKPDMMTTAKGLTSGVIPMGAVIVSDEIHDAFMRGPEHLIEFFHGYTYSGNPVAAAAGLGTLETYADEGLLTRAASLADYWQEKLHSLADHPHVIDIRNIGLIGAVELQPIEGAPTRRAFSAFLKAFEKGYMIRTTGDIIALSPPLIISTEQIDELIDCLGEVLREID